MDMTLALRELAEEGYHVRREQVAALSFYTYLGSTRRLPCAAEGRGPREPDQRMAAGDTILTDTPTNGWYWLDPAVALVIAVIIGYHALALVREVVAALRAASHASTTD